MASKETKVYGVLFLLLIAIITISNLTPKMKPETQSLGMAWVANYTTMVDRENISKDYLKSTDYYDYNNLLIQNKISQALSISKTPREYVSNAAELVYSEITYNYAATDSDCIGGTASQNFIVGKGDCTEQGLALITMLRGSGIAARAVGGCLYRSKTKSCGLFSVLPFKEPRYQEINQEEITNGKISRRQGIGSRSGGLHLFVEAWLPDDEVGDSMILDQSRKTAHGAWVVVEPTTGEIAKNDSCYSYNEELIIPDSRKDLFCTSENISYSLECAAR